MKWMNQYSPNQTVTTNVCATLQKRYIKKDKL